MGQNVSSLHKLKDIDNIERGFFIFGDISCRRLGTFRLQFNFFDFDKETSSVEYVTSIVSKEFAVVAQKDFSAINSTTLSRTFSDQGVKLRLRKEQRPLAGSKRGLEDSPQEPAGERYGAYGGPVYDPSHGYNAAGIKRQRTESDNPYRAPQFTGDPSSQLNVTPHGNEAAWLGHAQQGQPVAYGHVMGQPQVHTPSASYWQQATQQSPYASTQGSAHASHLYVPSRQYAYAGHPQQRYDSGVSHDVYQGLSNTAAPGDGMGPGHEQNYQLTGRDQAGLQYSHGPQVARPMSMNTQTYSGSTQPAASSMTFHQPPYLGNTASYDHSQITSDRQLTTEQHRETLAAVTSAMSDPNLSLDSGVLNRGFEQPPYAEQQHNPYGTAPANDAAELRQEFQPYQTTHHATPR